LNDIGGGGGKAGDGIGVGGMGDKGGRKYVGECSTGVGWGERQRPSEYGRGLGPRVGSENARRIGRVWGIEG